MIPLVIGLMGLVVMIVAAFMLVKGPKEYIIHAAEQPNLRFRISQYGTFEYTVALQKRYLSLGPIQYWRTVLDRRAWRKTIKHVEEDLYTAYKVENTPVTRRRSIKEELG